MDYTPNTNSKSNDQIYCRSQQAYVESNKLLNGDEYGWAYVVHPPGWLGYHKPKSYSKDTHMYQMDFDKNSNNLLSQMFNFVNNLCYGYPSGILGRYGTHFVLDKKSIGLNEYTKHYDADNNSRFTTYF